MEQDDDPQLLEGLQLEHHHEDLDDDGGQRQEVVPGQACVIRVPEPGGHKHCEEGGAEDAGPALLEAEDNELGELGADAAGRGTFKETARALIEALLQRSGTTHALRRAATFPVR